MKKSIHQLLQECEGPADKAVYTHARQEAVTWGDVRRYFREMDLKRKLQTSSRLSAVIALLVPIATAVFCCLIVATANVKARTAEIKRQTEQLRNQPEQIALAAAEPKPEAYKQCVALILEILKDLDVQPRQHTWSDQFREEEKAYPLLEELSKEAELFDQTDVAKLKKAKEELAGKSGDEAAAVTKKYRFDLHGYAARHVMHEINRQHTWRALVTRQKPVWEARAAEMEKNPPTDVIPGYHGKVFCSPDGKLLAVYNNNKTVSVLDMTTKKEVFQIEDGGNAAFSPDSKLIAVACWKDKVRVFDVATHKEVYQNEARWAHKVKWLRDCLIVTAQRDDLTVIRWSDKKVLLRMETLAYSPNVYDLKIKGDKVVAFQVQSTHGNGWVDLTRDPATVEALPGFLYGIHHESKISLWQGETLNEVVIQKENEIISRFVADPMDSRFFWNHDLSPKSDRVLVWDLWDGRILVWDLQGKKVFECRYGQGLGERYGLRWGHAVHSAVISHDGRSLIVSGTDGIKIWTLPQK